MDEKAEQEIAGTITQGPAIEKASDRPEYRDGITPTGWRLTFSANNRRMSAHILRHERYYGRRGPLDDLMLDEREVPFRILKELGVDRHMPTGFLSMCDSIEAIYRAAGEAADCFDLAERCGVLLKPYCCERQGPRIGAHTLVNLDVARLGYIVTQIRASNKRVRVAMAWAFKCNRRPDRAIKTYINIGSLYFNRAGSGVDFSTATASRTFNEGFSWLVGDVLTLDGSDLRDVLSDSGRAAVRAAVFNKDGDGEEASIVDRRAEFVREHPDLWDNVGDLCAAMISHGLYSLMTNVHFLKRAIEKLVRDARAKRTS